MCKNRYTSNTTWHGCQTLGGLGGPSQYKVLSHPSQAFGISLLQPQCPQKPGTSRPQAHFLKARRSPQPQGLQKPVISRPTEAHNLKASIRPQPQSPQPQSPQPQGLQKPTTLRPTEARNLKARRSCNLKARKSPCKSLTKAGKTIVLLPQISDCYNSGTFYFKQKIWLLFHILKIPFWYNGIEEGFGKMRKQSTDLMFFDIINVMLFIEGQN